MRSLNKALIIFVVSLGMVGTVTIISLQREPDLPVTVKPTGAEATYQPANLPGVSELSDQFREYVAGGRNPFILPTQKIQSEAEIELPPPMVRKPVYSLFIPLPDSNYYNPVIYTIPVADKSGDYQYSIPPLDESSLPRLDILSPSTEINQLIMQTIPKPVVEEKPPPDPFPDTLNMMDGSSFKGKYIKEDETTVYFQKENEKFYRGFDKKEIRQIDRTKSDEELYKERRAEVNTLTVGQANAHYRLAQWCLEKSLLPQAVTELVQAINLDASQMDFYLLLADTYRKQMELENELRIYQKALKSKELMHKEIIHIRISDLYKILGQYQEMCESLKSAVKLAPNDLMALAQLTYGYYLVSDYKHAEESYAEAARISSTDPTVICLAGLLAFKKGEFARAKDALQKIVDDDINIIPKDELYAVLGVTTAYLKDYNLAQSYFKSAIRINPYQASHWTNLAMLYLLAGEKQITNQIILEAIKRDPASALPYLARGYLLWGENRLAEAEQDLESARKINPRHPLLQYTTALLSFTKGNISTARQGFSNLLKNPAQSEAFFSECLYYLGLIAQKEDKYSDAVTYFKAYLARPGSKNLISNYVLVAQSYLGLGEWNQAKSYLDQALALNPNYAPALNSSAYLSYKTKRYDESVTIFKKVLSLYIDDRYARSALEAIQDALTQRVWRDIFDRYDNLNIGEGWTENEFSGGGIEIDLSNKKARFKGTQLKDLGITSLERPVESNNFISFEAELETKKINGAGVGIYLASKEQSKGAFFYGFVPPITPTGHYQVGWQISSSPETVSPEWNKLPVEFNQDAEVVKLTLRKGWDARKQPELRIAYNGRQIAVVPFSQAKFLATAKSYLVGIFGYAPANTSWELSARAVQVIEKK